jgi:hypothetical protein
LLSIPLSLGGEPPLPLSVADGFAGMSVRETLTLLLAIERCSEVPDRLRVFTLPHMKFDAGDQFIDAASQSQGQPQIVHALAR